MKQILAIAPILPGQSAQSANQPPQQANTNRAPVQQQQESPQQQRPAQNDLIDFGQHESKSNPTQVTSPNIAPESSQTQHVSQQMSGSVHPQQISKQMSGLSLEDASQPRIHRLDSTDGREDEFVDAES